MKTVSETPGEMLKNIKSALEKKSFLLEDFYTAENLKKTFGDYIFKWTENEPTHKFIVFEARSDSHGTPDERQLCIGYGVIVWRVMESENKARRTIVQITGNNKDADPRCASFSADLIENIFGRPTKVVEIFGGPNSLPHGRNIVPRPKTHPLGNTDISYELREHTTLNTLTFEILGNGVAGGFALSIGDN